jgi:endonuclease YncB( thermonuclease family)
MRSPDSSRGAFGRHTGGADATRVAPSSHFEIAESMIREPLAKLLVITFLALGATASAAATKTVSGAARVTDGDTILIGEERIRLEGIDAPETDQRCLDQEHQPFLCGLRARDVLVDLIGGARVTCEGQDLDQYGRWLMVCSTGGREVNEEMVKSGWALAFVRYSSRYAAQEQFARESARGLWAGAFIAPWDWRRPGPETEILGAISVPANAQSLLLPSNPSASEAATGCRIKGNINRNGERIYHLPGARDYDRTRVNERNGERWFCTEEEARAAGWRPAR